MNTAKSFWFGWGSLCAAGGIAYYFAKKSINADRMARLHEQRQRKLISDSLERTGGLPNGGPAQTDAAGSPSMESSKDPAPTRHAPATAGQQVLEKSKYESNVPFQSTKGDRFS